MSIVIIIIINLGSHKHQSHMVVSELWVLRLGHFIAEPIKEYPLSHLSWGAGRKRWAIAYLWCPLPDQRFLDLKLCENKWVGAVMARRAGRAQPQSQMAVPAEGVVLWQRSWESILQWRRSILHKENVRDKEENLSGGLRLSLREDRLEEGVSVAAHTRVAIWEGQTLWLMGLSSFHLFLCVCVL